VPTWPKAGRHSGGRTHLWLIRGMKGRERLARSQSCPEARVGPGIGAWALARDALIRRAFCARRASLKIVVSRVRVPVSPCNSPSSFGALGSGRAALLSRLVCSSTAWATRRDEQRDRAPCPLDDAERDEPGEEEWSGARKISPDVRCDVAQDGAAGRPAQGRGRHARLSRRRRSSSIGARCDRLRSASLIGHSYGSRSRPRRGVAPLPSAR
jgi:hypothetical protein